MNHIVKGSFFINLAVSKRPKISDRRDLIHACYQSRMKECMPLLCDWRFSAQLPLPCSNPDFSEKSRDVPWTETASKILLSAP